jgi:hypothetical protein
MAITGKDGTVTWAAGDGYIGAAIDINAWSLNLTQEVINSSAFGDTNTLHPTFMGGQVGATGSISGLATTGGVAFDPAVISGTLAAMSLATNTGDSYAFDAILSGCTTSVNRNGEATVSINFTASGVITAASA